LAAGRHGQATAELTRIDPPRPLFCEALRGACSPQCDTAARGSLILTEILLRYPNQDKWVSL
jgi:hypothetical protein